MNKQSLPQHHKSNQDVDFAAVKAASIRVASSLVPAWLPRGHQEGNEWIALNPTRHDTGPGSFKVNLSTGVWSDFATGDKGADPIDLYAHLYRVSLLKAATELSDILGVPPVSNVASLHAPSLCVPHSSLWRAQAAASPEQSQLDPETFPERTQPDGEGRPTFKIAGDEGPPAFSEKRRQIYKSGTTPIKIKGIREKGAHIWYRVSDGSVTGWQLRKPVGFREVPYFGSLDPNDPERRDELLFWPEGEKDTDSVTARGALALTFGGTGDGLPAGCEEYFRGRHVVILADNDAPGREHATKKADLAATVAASVKVVHFTELEEKGDVSDYLELGGTLETLKQIVNQTMLYNPQIADGPAITGAHAEPPPVFKATPYFWTDPKKIPRRDFLYGHHLIRKFVSATIAPGGVGKSSLIVTEALSMASGKPLLGIHPSSRSRVWLWNLEDPYDEISRHIQATAQHYDLSPRDFEGHLFVDSGRDQRLVIATADRFGTLIRDPVVDALVAEIVARGIDVLYVDPFVSSHEAPENDNGAMDRIVKAWGRVAQQANCAVELIHHSRKSAAGETETTVESSRGGKALTDGCRSVRVLNRMSKQEAENAGVENPRSYFRTFVDKANLAPPAETSEWFHLKSVDLGNHTTDGDGDSVT